jgi:hypothetical protein
VFCDFKQTILQKAFAQVDFIPTFAARKRRKAVVLKHKANKLKNKFARIIKVPTFAVPKQTGQKFRKRFPNLKLKYQTSERMIKIPSKP